MPFVAFIESNGGGGGGLGYVEYVGHTPAPGGAPSGAAATARASFLARLVGTIAVEAFEGATVGDVIDGVGFSRNGVTMTIDNDGNALCSNDGFGLGQFNTTAGGAKWADTLVTNGSTLTCRFDFSAPISHFGAYLTDCGDFLEGPVKARLFIHGGGTYVSTVTATGRASGSLTFWGFVDDTSTYDAVEFFADATGMATEDAIGFDDLVYGKAADII